MPMCFILKYRKELGLDRIRGGKKLRVFKGVGTLIRVHCVRRNLIFNKGKITILYIGSILYISLLTQPFHSYFQYCFSSNPEVIQYFIFYCMCILSSVSVSACAHV